MYDLELILEDLRHIAWSLDQIEKRFSSVVTPDDFMKDDNGIEKLDSICLQLIAIGETLKHLDKLTESKLLLLYPDVDWKKAKGLRDIITHHYFDIDSETIFAVCKEHLPAMRKIVEIIVDDLFREGVSLIPGEALRQKL
jgi:uncharacterized protein with HEPN domain